jgi:hypothetical protein
MDPNVLIMVTYLQVAGLVSAIFTFLFSFNDENRIKKIIIRKNRNYFYFDMKFNKEFM